MQKKQIVLIAQTVVALALVEGLAIVSSLVSRGGYAPALLPAINARQFLLTFLISTGLMLFLVRRLRQRIFFEIIFSLSIFSGVWFLAALFVPSYAFFLAAALLAIRYFFPYVLFQNILMILGIAGVASAIGASTPWQTMAIVIAVLAVYDVIAVYGTKHMVTMFKGMLAQGVVFALVIPEHPRMLLRRMKDVGPGEGFSFLGSGDLALPSLFVASAAHESLGLGLGAAVGSIVGLLATDFIFQRGGKRPMPALPPIAIGTLAGFFAARFFV